MEREFSYYHPAVNFIYFASVTGFAVFSLNSVLLGMGFAAAWIYSLILLGRKEGLKLLFYGIPIFFFMVLIRPLFHNNGMTVLFYINESRVTLEAVLHGMAATVLFLTILIWFRCCSVLITSDKLIYLFGRIAPSLALMISMVFRFIPLLKTRYREVSYGQKGMCQTPKDEKLLTKCRRVVKQVSILITWSLETSIETADSMEARGYRLKGRTCFHLFRFTKKDALMVLIILFLTGITAAGYITGRMTVLFYPKFVLPSFDLFGYISTAGYFLLLLLPMAIEMEGVRKWKQYNLNI